MRYGTWLLIGLAGLMLTPQTRHMPTIIRRAAFTLIAPWPPAGAIDVLCRELAPGVGDRLGQPIVVENRPGAGSTIGTNDAAKAKPDGYTLLMAGTGALAISPTLYKSLPYDPQRDFTPIALVAKNPFVLVVNPALPIQSVAGPDQIRQRTSRIAHLRLRRCRLAASALRRNVQDHDRH